MREVGCKSLGYDCSWKHVARTEELLTDIFAIHLREVHGVRELTPDMIGTIRRIFSNPQPVQIPMDEEPVLKEVVCKDLGNNCGWRYIAQTEELIADGVAVHAREAHGITEFSPEMATKVKNLVRPWRG